MKTISAFLFLAGLLCMFGCTGQKPAQESTQPAVAVQVPRFNADSAYRYVQEQVDFGARVPNSAAHRACAAYLIGKLKSFGAEVTEQRVELTAYNGDRLQAVNIIGEYAPQNRKRVLLCAHWDSRPWADSDPDAKNHRTPVLGADDGASGVGVLLEIARQLQQHVPEVGVDILFFDAEDYGIAEFDKEKYHAEDSWCLGSQYWSRRPHVQGYNARFGILLDMVGGKEATFYKEHTSQRNAPSVVKKVWDSAQQLGYGAFFPQTEEGSAVVDDHYYVNRYARIPCIDIINYNVDSRSGFGDRWHTLDDTMDGIDRATLEAVGQTVLHVIFNER